MTSEIYNSKASAKKAIASIKRGAVMARITE